MINVFGITPGIATRFEAQIAEAMQQHEREAGHVPSVPVSVGARAGLRTADEQRRARVKAMFNKGWKPETIAARLGCSLNTVKNDAGALGLVWGSRRLNRTTPEMEARRDRVEEMAAAGYSQSQAAAELGVPKGIIYSDARARGVRFSCLRWPA